MNQLHLIGTWLFKWLPRSKVQWELNVECLKPTGYKPLMDLCYIGCHLDIFGTAHLNVKKEMM